jgi:hypothetical protein
MVVLLSLPTQLTHMPIYRPSHPIPHSFILSLMHANRGKLILVRKLRKLSSVSLLKKLSTQRKQRENR